MTTSPPEPEAAVRQTPRERLQRIVDAYFGGGDNAVDAIDGGPEPTSFKLACSARAYLAAPQPQPFEPRPVWYWTEGKPHCRVTNAVLIGPDRLIVNLNTVSGREVVGKPDWFDADYVEHWGGLVPESATQGEEAGQWSDAPRLWTLYERQPQPDPDAKLRELREWADSKSFSACGPHKDPWTVDLLAKIDSLLASATPPPSSPPAAPHATHFDPGAEAMSAERTEDGSPASELSIIAGIDMVIDHARGDKVSDAVRRLASSYVEQIKRATKAEAERDRMREGAEYNAKQLAKAEANLKLLEEQVDLADRLRDQLVKEADASSREKQKAEAALAEAKRAIDTIRGCVLADPKDEWPIAEIAADIRSRCARYENLQREYDGLLRVVVALGRQLPP